MAHFKDPILGDVHTHAMRDLAVDAFSLVDEGDFERLIGKRGAYPGSGLDIGLAGGVFL